MYPSYPSAGQPPLPAPQAPPPTVLNAVRLMYAGAALSVVWLVTTLSMIGSVRHALQTGTFRTSGTTGTMLVGPSGKLTAHAISTFITAYVAVAIIFTIVFIALWVWMAWANRRGKYWARIVSTVFFGLFTLFTLLLVLRGTASISFLITIVTWLVGLGAVILIWNRKSGPYYQVMSGRPA
ncbi:MAG TPA: hypothetical protein VF834_01570 [Streptosporangiaceae bacterium]